MCCIRHPHFKASIELRVRLPPHSAPQTKALLPLTQTATQARAGSPRSTVRPRTFQFCRRCILWYQPEEIFCISRFRQSRHSFVPMRWGTNNPLLGRHEPVVSGTHFDEGFGRLGG